MTTNKLNVCEALKKDYSSLDSFVILMCTEGKATVTTNNITEVVTKGSTILLPATTDQTYFFSKGAQFLEVYLGDYTTPKSSSAFDKRHLAVAS